MLYYILLGEKKLHTKHPPFVWDYWKNSIVLFLLYIIYLTFDRYMLYYIKKENNYEFQGF